MTTQTSPAARPSSMLDAWISSNPWNNWFHGALSEPLRQGASPGWRMPAIDVAEDEKEILVRAEVPGLSKQDLVITYEEGVLYIRGEKKGEKEEKQRNLSYRESWSGEFSRAIPVGNAVEWSKAAARFKDGVLTITLPRIRGGEGPARKISVQ